MTIRFFVPEAALAKAAPGTADPLSAAMAAAASRPATITHVASQPEFTPPVIYSEGARAKLVFLVEAQARWRRDRELRPGLPIEVEPLP